MMILFPLTFLSNAFVPADTLPSWLQTFVNINPVSHLVSATRDLANNGAVTAEVGWTLLAGLRGDRDLRAAVRAQLPAPHVGVTRRSARRAHAPRRADHAAGGRGSPACSAAIRPGARSSARGAIRSHAMVGIVRL